jgi:hypothetical protein
MAKKYQGLFEKGSLIQDKSLIQHEQAKQQIVVFPELEALIPPLQDEEANALEASILQEGCREALIVWEYEQQLVLVDGHNRFRFCRKHGIDFKMSIKPFGGLAEVKEWMVQNQLSRRNLTPEQASYLRGMRYSLEKKEKGGFDKIKSKGQNVLLTSERLSEEYNVSEKTIKRDAAFAQGIEKIGKANPALKQDILAGRVKVNKGDVQKISKIPGEIQVAHAGDIELLVSPESAQSPEVSEELEKMKKRILRLLEDVSHGSHDLYARLKAEVDALGKLL